MKKNQGFSLVEMLIVVAIIGVLSTVSLVSFGSARRSARDARRLSDIKQIQLALKSFYTDNGYYPTTVTPGRSIGSGSNSYLLQVPSNPQPRSEKGCPDQDYTYTQLEDGQRYALSFCLSGHTDNLDSGIKAVTNDGILNCPAGYVPVVGSSFFNTSDFCVMQYEAKCDAGSQPLTAVGAYDDGASSCVATGKVVSTFSRTPIANITVDGARAACESIGAHLMTNNEWMTIVRDAELRPENWYDGLTQFSYLPTGNSLDDVVLDGSLEFSQKGGNDFTYRRTLYLSTGHKIWDMAGNVAEFVDGTCQTGDGEGYYYDTGSSFYTWDDSQLLDYEAPISGPKDATPNNDKNYGNYIGCTLNDNGMKRGGAVGSHDAGHFNLPGMYMLDLTKTTTDQDDRTGFRCVL